MDHFELQATMPVRMTSWERILPVPKMFILVSFILIVQLQILVRSGSSGQPESTLAASAITAFDSVFLYRLKRTTACVFSKKKCLWGIQPANSLKPLMSSEIFELFSCIGDEAGK